MPSAPLHPCARCALMQPTCCEQTEIVVTGGDRERIGVASGRDDFWERKAPADPADALVDPDDPNWERWTVAVDGTRAILRHRADGACTFLGAQGCSLDECTRPLVCRLYPWTYGEHGIDGDGATYCPTVLLRDEPVGTTMVMLLHMERDQAEFWRAQLYGELAEDAAEGERHS